MKRSLILHIDGDAFFASVEQSFFPELRNKPVVVGGLASQRGVVHTASYEARRYGIGIGMPLFKAKEICPSCIFLKGNFQHYQAVSRHLQDIYLSFTPVVEFTSLDDAYLDLSGTERLYHSPLLVARDLWLRIWQELHISVSIGIGANKLLARLASDVNKPGGVFDVPHNCEMAFLAPLAVNRLPGIGRVVKTRLHEFGIYTIAQLQRLPRLTLENLFGVNGRKYYEMARGIDSRIVEKRIRPKSVSRETTFEEDLIDMSVVRATLHYLCERIAGKLRSDGLVGREITVKLRYADFKQREQRLTLRDASDDAGVIYAAVAELLQKLPERRVRIRLVGVRVAQIDWKDWQTNLFDQPLLTGNVNDAVDSIRDKYGFTSIMPAATLHLQQKYRMEKSGFVLHSPALTE
jgi:DNA polymerase-4